MHPHLSLKYVIYYGNVCIVHISFVGELYLCGNNVVTSQNGDKFICGAHLHSVIVITMSAYTFHYIVPAYAFSIYYYVHNQIKCKV